MSDSPTTSQTYQYHPLTEQGTIRLLKLESSDDADAAVRGSLSVAKLEHAPEFEALSYCWGDRSADEPGIYIDGQSLSVTKDLHSALLRLRQRDKPIWIDAICINQGDTTERTQQVRQMHEIYGSASLVIVWLGEPSIEDLQGFRFAEGLLTGFSMCVKERQRGLCEHDSHPIEIYDDDILMYAQDYVDSVLAHGAQQAPELRAPAAASGTKIAPLWIFAYTAIFAKDWFVRTWIVQEVCLARQVLVQCGDIEMPFDDFYNTLRIAQCSSLGLYAGDSPKALSIHRGSKAMNSISRLRKRFRDGSELPVEQSLLARVQRFGYTLATDPRDRVFALVGLTSPDLIPWPLLPDYSPDNTFSTVCMHMARYHLICERDVRVLSSVLTCPDCPLGDLALPSWVPDLRQQSCQIAPVSRTFQELVAFTASGTSWLRLEVCNEEATVIAVRGRRFDAVSALGDYTARSTAIDAFYSRTPVQTWFSTDAVTLEQALECHEKFNSAWTQYYASLFTTMKVNSKVLAMYGRGDSLVEAFWRTLCCNYDLMRNAHTAATARSLDSSLAAIREGKKPSAAMGRHILDELGMENFGSSDDQKHTASATVTTLTEGRNWTITEGGYVGWVPFATLSGDEVAIIAGLDAPFVIRPVGDGNYRLIGECYIHGVMEGEIVLAEDYEAEEICLV